jgi:hypothetical protein
VFFFFNLFSVAGLYRILKPIFDAVLTVPTDDSPSALAAAAVLYLMACDVSIRNSLF